MNFDPELWLRIKDKKVTPHQIKILSELEKTHSQTKAAANLGISVPVFHRHLRSLVKKLNANLVISTPNGTWLTDESRLLLRIYNRYQDMLLRQKRTVLYCTPITHNLLIDIITDMEIKGKKYHISVNDDSQNLKALYLGRADLVLFDDPAFAMEFEGLKDDKILTVDIFNDTLVHIDNGEEYIRYKYGAQRIGFRFLEANLKKYKILHEVSNFKYIIQSNKSFFINQSLLKSNKIQIKSDSNSKFFIHPIIAVSINPTEELRNIVKELRQKSNELK